VFLNGFELSTILRVGPDGLARVVTRDSRNERESALVEDFEAELLVLRRWTDFHRRALGFKLVLYDRRESHGRSDAPCCSLQSRLGR